MQEVGRGYTKELNGDMWGGGGTYECMREGGRSVMWEKCDERGL